MGSPQAAAPRRVLVVGGSIAAVTAAEALRLEGFEGEVTLLSEERHPPYSRVPLSKGVLRGTQDPGSVALPALPDGVTLRLGERAVGLDVERRRVALAGGGVEPYDDLVVATGARARRLAGPGQTGEHVVRTVEDATALAARIGSARSVVVVGAGFLGMEVASTCVDLGLAVTVVDRDPPLRRLLGSWLADLVVDAARERGVRFVRAPGGVALLGLPEVAGVDCGDRQLTADVVVTAVGDVAATDWLDGSGLPLRGGLVADPRGRVAPHVVAAGDVVVTRGPGSGHHRSPHWTSAVAQARAAAATLVHGGSADPPRPDPYFWTEQFGLDVKISGVLPDGLPPTVLAGDPARRSALLQWSDGGRPVAAVALNHRIPVVRLKKLGAGAA